MEFRAELLRVAGEALGEVAAEDLGETDDVVEVLGVEKLAARLPAFDDRGPEEGAARIERRRHAGGARSDDHYVVIAYGRHRCIPGSERTPCPQGES